MTTILLDIDGTLIDSNDAHANSWLDTFKEFNIETDFKTIRSKIGKGGDHLMPEVSGINKDSPLGQKISKRRTEIFREN